MSHQHEICDCGCGHDEEKTGEKAWLKLIVCVVVFFSGMFVSGLLSLPSFLKAVWMAAAVVPFFFPLLKEALEELRNRTMGEHILLSIAVVAAFIIGECVEGTMVLLLFALGEMIEHRMMDYSRRTISSLAAVTPDAAIRVYDDGQTREISASEVAVGDTLHIPPHSRVPVDCCVISGESEIDFSAITGESEPICCTAGTRLLSGCVNGTGALTVTATRVNADSAAARILRLVEDAVEKKGRSERFITRFARVYTPMVMMLALLVALLPPLFGGEWSTWVYRALAFLVACCPCALVISIPLSFYAGIAAAARRGILIKGGCFVETLAKVQAVALDKTGTLTTNALWLKSVETINRVSSEEALHIAAALEKHSTHPAARAICAAVDATLLPHVQDRRELPALGVVAVVDGCQCACGGVRLMEHLQADVSALPQAPVYLYRDGAVIAAFLMSAVLQEGVADCVEQLRLMGIRRLVMLTGDRQARADEIASAVSISEVHGDLLPEDKLISVHDLQAKGYTTAFVGDGINDAPVLAAADIGIAMGLGSAAAIEIADAVLVSGGLSRLPEAVKISRRVVHAVWSNILLAIGAKALVLALAVCGIAPMWLAVLADTGVMVLCVLNALRLLIHINKSK